MLKCKYGMLGVITIARIETSRLRPNLVSESVCGLRGVDLKWYEKVQNHVFRTFDELGVLHDRIRLFQRVPRVI